MSDLAFDYPVVTMFALLVAAVVLLVGVLALLRRWKLYDKWAALATGLLSAALFVVPMTHVFAVSRDRMNTRNAVRAKHLEALQQALQRDSSMLGDIARKVLEMGTATFGSDDSELKDRFYPDALSRDFANHFADYAQKKETLRTDVVAQNRETNEAMSRVIRMLTSHILREPIARSIVLNCVGLRGMSLQIEPKLYIFSWGGGSSSNPSGGTPDRELVEAFEMYKAFSPDTETTTECQKLKARAARLADNALSLGADAKSLGATSAVTGDCPYLRLPQ